jgi:predicted transport protein
MEKGLLEKTGKDLNHWIDVVKKSGIEKHKAIIDFLKAEHGFTYGFANFVAMKARKADAGSHSAEDLISNQYQGKESLFPIYESLRKEILKMGKDISENPKKAASSFVRKKQFALIKPATKTRIDLGLKIRDQDPSGKLESSGPFGTMCTHRIKIQSTEDLDEELYDWIRQAYNQAD